MLRKNSILDFTSWRLNESLSSARARFLKSGLVDQETFDQLKSLDPTPTFKYLEKIIGFYLNDNVPIEELGKVISRFHTLLGKNQVQTRDINAFKSFDDLKSETQSSETQYVSKQETRARARDYDLVHEDKDWIVIIPRTHEASCRYGAGTKWCTTEKDAENYKTYIRIGVTLYYIISKKLPMENKFYKMAVAVGTNGVKECFDSKDEKMSLDEVLEKSGLSASLFVSNPTPLTLSEKLGLDESKITENPDGSIDYDGDIDISELGLDRIHVNFRRVRVRGNFNCSRNRLTSLEGAPEEVGGGFNCSHNMLTSLEGAPKKVGLDFNCHSNNRLTSLEGAPEEVGGIFWCSVENLPESEKEWAQKNIKAKSFQF